MHDSGSPQPPQRKMQGVGKGLEAVKCKNGRTGDTAKTSHRHSKELCVKMKGPGFPPLHGVAWERGGNFPYASPFDTNQLLQRRRRP